jgi:hypothetical protein
VANLHSEEFDSSGTDVSALERCLYIIQGSGLEGFTVKILSMTCERKPRSMLHMCGRNNSFLLKCFVLSGYSII